jgi:mono/diheme cytochrome c family protein
MNGFYPVKRWVLSLFLFILINLSGLFAFAQPDGEALFNTNCKQCHSPGDNVVIGPGLKGVESRRNKDWIVKWVHNSQAVVKAGDPYGVALFNKFNGVVMTPFPNLKEDEIVSILTYIKSVKQPAAQAPVQGVEAKPEPKGFPWLWLVLAGLLLVLFNVLGQVQKGLQKALRAKNDIPEPAPVTQERAIKNWIRGNKKLIAVGLIVLITVGSWKGWYALAAIGVNTDYQPEQPIHFSHKIHAGQNGINCVYCHSGAEKSRHANVPSANVCMNCHKYVKSGSMTGETEIAKIYKAIDFDPNTQQYGNNPKPIQWVKIHNLPDFAYFNHSQHVMVGKIECQKCHGPVEEMEVVKQFSPLTMGWCIDCHRNTEVKMEGNGYYTELHKTLMAKYGPETKLTVDKIGGLECARCHY